MFYNLINERVINKNKSIFDKVRCVFKIKSVKLIESCSNFNIGEKNE